MTDRRTFIKGAAAFPLMLNSAFVLAEQNQSLRARLSLSQWSFHRAILGDSKADYQQFIKTLHSNPDDVLQGPMETRDIVKVARKLDIDSIDLVNVLLFGHAQDKPWLKEFLNKANDNGVSFQVLMCDETGCTWRVRCQQQGNRRLRTINPG